MAALAELQVAPVLLSRLITGSPTLALLQAVAWFDPTSLHDPTGEAYIDFDYDAENELTTGLHVCRACFPDLYAAANALLMQGWPERELARFICEGINAQLVTPIESLEALRYGPPLECYGVDPTLLAEVDDPEHIIYRSRAVYTLFGLAIDSDDMDGDWSGARLAVDILHHSLEQQPTSDYRDLDALLSWMFSASGNSLVDWSQEAMWESGAEYPDWSLEDIAFVNDMTREAQDIMHAAESGFILLENDTTLRKALRRNIRTIYKHIERREKRNARTYFTDDECGAIAQRLAWPEHDGNRAQRPPDAHAELLPVRRDLAQNA